MMRDALLKSFTSLPRDKADTLLVLVTCFLVLAPHAAYLPLWTPFACMGLLLWRGWITFHGNRMPPRWILLPFAVAAMGAVFITHKTFLGREAGVTMLTLLLTLKLLEMRAKRDLFVVVFLSLFLMLAMLLNSQSIAIAAYMVVALTVLLATQLTFQYADTVPPLSRRLHTSAKIIALAVPVMLVLFVLFPRIEGPLWGMPRDALTARTGMSDTMSPGDIAQIAGSEEIAFRVNFIDPPPPQDKLYWRGPVLGHFNGRTWTPMAHSDTNSEITIRRRGAPIRHQVTLEPTGRRWLFALEMPQSAPDIAGYPAGFNADLQLLSLRSLHERVRYDAISYLDFNVQPDADPGELRRWMALPPQFNPRTHRFAAELRRKFSRPEEIVNAALQFFRNEPFHYTLEPPLLGTHTVDEFLFSTRAGFCEHYSSAFVVLMRAAGIPARVVTGYQGGEINLVDGYMAVRQSDAHAWAEVWLPQRGWVRIDPTAAVAPQRVQQGLLSALPRDAASGFDMLGIRNSSWLAAWRMNWDAVNNHWNQLVLTYSLDKQRDLLQRIGFKEPDWRTLTALMAIFGIMAAAMVALLLFRRGSKRDPVQACYDRLCQQLMHNGLPRAIHEGPRAYCTRVTAPDSPLDPEKKSAVRRFLDLYESLQYAATPPDVRSRAISKLKFMLAKCR